MRWLWVRSESVSKWLTPLTYALSHNVVILYPGSGPLRGRKAIDCKEHLFLCCLIKGARQCIAIIAIMHLGYLYEPLTSLLIARKWYVFLALRKKNCAYFWFGCRVSKCNVGNRCCSDNSAAWSNAIPRRLAAATLRISGFAAPSLSLVA